MSTDANQALVERYYAIWNSGDAAALAEVIAPDYAVHDPGTPGRPGGLEGERQTLQMYRTVFPDLHFTLDDVLAEGDRVVVRWTGRGTQRGELMGIPATGKQGTVTAIGIVRIEGGKIAEHWLNWDTLGLLQQLGAIPAPGSAGQ